MYNGWISLKPRPPSVKILLRYKNATLHSPDPPFLIERESGLKFMFNHVYLISVISRTGLLVG